jgi:hypothetical protein
MGRGPHLDEKTKKELLDSTPEWLREARSKGEPTMGSGNIYPIPWSDIEIAPFQIPSSWKRGYGLDVGWNRTAAVWGAQDAIEGTIYLYAEHYLGREKPVVHAASIKERGAWQKGAIDPASRGSSQDEGKKLIDLYKSEGLNLINANNRIKSTTARALPSRRSGRCFPCGASGFSRRCKTSIRNIASTGATSTARWSRKTITLWTPSAT